jgi:hypothetical protein
MPFRVSALLITLLIFFVLSGCAPLKVDLSGSDKFVDRQGQTSPSYDYKLVVLNRAAETKMDRRLFGSSVFPLKSEAGTPMDTLEIDIKRYFGHITSRIDNERRIVVRINKADAYWINPGVNTIPFVGMITVWMAQYPYVFDISVTFEVEENGKFIRSYIFTQKFEILDGDVASDAKIEESYQRLIARYRQIMFDTLDQEFIPRYLNKPEAVMSVSGDLSINSISNKP